MLKNYLKTAWVVFMRRKFFTFVNLFGITFTLAILMIASAMLDHIFGGTPPEVNQRRTLGIYRVSMCEDSEEGRDMGISAMASAYMLEQCMEDLPGVENTSIIGMFWQVLSFIDNRKVTSYLRNVDANFWEIMQFEFIEGRPFTHDEYDNGANVAVINEATRDKFFGNTECVGNSFEANGKSYRVVGVVENVPILRFTPFADIWVPHTTDPGYNQNNELVGLYIGLMLAESRDAFPMIKEEFISRVNNLDISAYHPNNKIISVPETFLDNIARLIFSFGLSTGNFTKQLYIAAFILMILFMVLPTLNMVNLNMSRIMERSSEIGVRKAFGAPSATLVGQFLVENIVLTSAGGLLALLIAYVVLAVISSTGVIPYAQFTLNIRIFLTAVGIAFVFGTFSGVYPAWRMSRMNPVDALRGGAA